MWWLAIALAACRFAAAAEHAPCPAPQAWPSQLEDVAFGVKKIICSAVINQTMSMDAIIEEITEEAFADEVQSMTMTSMSLL